MILVLVEGESDAVAVRVLARRRGLAEPALIAVGGSTGARREAARHPGRRMIGLVDVGERRHFERVLGTVFVCDPDLEGELIRALGTARVEAVIDAQGELASFRRLQQQPFQVGRATDQHLTRFLAGRSGNKVRYARLLAEALPLDAVPAPIAALLDELEHGADPHGAEPHGAEPHGAEPHGAEPHGAEPHGAEPHGAEPHGADAPDDKIVAVLRAAGCVFAEEEATHLTAAATDEDHLTHLVARRVAGEPLEHVVGRVDVHGLHLSVGPGVFVPRRRTALLVSVTLAAVREILGRALVVEAFSGVAPVASAVRRSLPGAEVHATDADPAALVHAATNVGVDVANHGDTTANLGDHAHVHRGDVLAGLPPELRGRVDVIAAVPPYVPTGAIDLLPREARDHEPAAALAGGADGLDAVRALVRQARDWLAPGGRVLVEMHRDQVATARELAEQLGYEARHVDGDDGQTAVLVLRGRTGQPG